MRLRRRRRLGALLVAVISFRRLLDFLLLLTMKKKKRDKIKSYWNITESFTVNNTKLLIVFVLRPKKVSTHDIIILTFQNINYASS